jgi:hypothetical protein
VVGDVRQQTAGDEIAPSARHLEQAERRLVGEVAVGLAAVGGGEQAAMGFVQLAVVGRIGDAARDLVEAAEGIEDALPLVRAARDLEQQAVDLELRACLEGSAQVVVDDRTLEELELAVAPGEQREQVFPDLHADDLVDLVLRDQSGLHQQLADRQLLLALRDQHLPQLVDLQQAGVDQPLAEAPRREAHRHQHPDVAVAAVDLALFQGVADPQHTLHLRHAERLEDVGQVDLLEIASHRHRLSFAGRR